MKVRPHAACMPCCRPSAAEGAYAMRCRCSGFATLASLGKLTAYSRCDASSLFLPFGAVSHSFAACCMAAWAGGAFRALAERVRSGWRASTLPTAQNCLAGSGEACVLVLPVFGLHRSEPVSGTVPTGCCFFAPCVPATFVPAFFVATAYAFRAIFLNFFVYILQKM